MSKKVIMLTGAPATGKSTLRRSLTASNEFYTVDYGQLLLEHKNSKGGTLTYEQMRQQSSGVISYEDVSQVDERLISAVTNVRKSHHVLIDSHPVTRERYGFRVAPYSDEQLKRLSLDVVIALHLDPDQLVQRIEANPEGRLPIDRGLAAQHQLLQESTAIHYSIVCHCPCFIVDTTDLDADTVRDSVLGLLGSIGV